ncbi:actin cytoskeleton-regulatory complex protein PAN1 [Striga asiatica]|uniref:Actin cytoskeleton-regulatory complex protein PAN1 n=1 Tax=Striga asiatica TaxID=4170 RepID=A0A5A7PHW7_STRAF|nr:actin cytoskeleton-regulatory complex protein PAN1 [Striga asiatica]
MTTVEKLLVQIFERKNSIIEHVKQQTELYSQHLASKLIIDGIKPPSWLWSPNTSSDSNELNKEELISKLLRPYPRSPSARCSIPYHPGYDNLVVTGDTENISAGVFMGNLVFGEGVKEQDHSTRPPLSSEEPAGRAVNSVPEPEVSVTSPEDQTDERIANIYNEPDQSLARIQRSKPRQKALQLRKSAKASNTSGRSNENIRNAVSGKIIFSLSATNKAGQTDKQSKFVEQCVTGCQSRADWNLDNAGIPRSIKENNTYSGRITRSRNNLKVPDLERGSLALGCSSEISKDGAFHHISEVSRMKTMHISDSEKAHYSVNEAKSAGPSTVYCQNPGDKKVDGADCLLNDRSNFLAGKISRSSISSKCQGRGHDSSKAENSFDYNQRITTVMMESKDDLPPRAVYGSPSKSSNLLNCGCLSEIFKVDAFPHISEERKTQSMHISDSGEAHDYANKKPKSTGSPIVNHQNSGDKKMHGADCLSNDKSINLLACRISGSSISSKCQSCSRDSSKADISSNNYQRIDSVMMDSGDNLPTQSVYGSPLNLPKVLNEGYDTRESISGDSQSHRAKGDDSPCSSDQQNACPTEACDVEIHSDSVKADDGILVPLSGKSDQEVSDAKEEDWSGERNGESQLVSSVPGKRDLKASKDKNHLIFSAPGSGNLSAPMDQSQLVSSTPESQKIRASHAYVLGEVPVAESCDSMIGNVGTLSEICGVLETIEQFPAQQSQSCSCLEGRLCSQHRDSPFGDNACVTYGTNSPCGESSTPERRFRLAKMESWPQLKRRKLEHKNTHNLTSSTFKLRKPHRTQSISTVFGNIETNLDSVVDTFNADRLTDIAIPPVMVSNVEERIESAFSSENGKVGFCYKEKNEQNNSSSVVNNEPLGAALVSSVEKESVNTQGCFTKDISDADSSSNYFDARERYGQLSQHLCTLEKITDDLGSANLTLTNTMLEDIQSSKWESDEQAQLSDLSPRTISLKLIDVDQSMPVLEGFIVDAQADSVELAFVPDEIDFDKLKLPSNTIERASILAEICRSASLDKPSPAFEFHGNRISTPSIPNEHLDLACSLPSDVGEQLQSRRRCVGDCEETLEGMPCSDYLPYSSAHYGWNLRGQHTSPVGKLWERLSFHTGSSEKRLSSNPELTCFPIEEDASISEENKTMDENAFDVHEVDSSVAKHRDNRQPLKNLSNLGLNSPALVSAHEKTLMADRVNSLGTKLSVVGTQDKAQSGRKNQHVNSSVTRKKQASSIGANDGRKNHPSFQGTNSIKAKEASDSINKSLISIKSSLKGQDKKLSSEESKRNNIISNISSFIPLVQQKQAATACPGKRDVKVRALKAAEAAKRVEEKKENERKKRKEALKLERVKLEEKNMRQLELKKKKKEEELQKKDAAILAKKRQREEEYKKEKEKKRMRHEARYRQRIQVEKLTASKAEKENQLSKDEQMNSKKESLHESMTIVRGDGKADTKSTANEIMTTFEECGTSGQSCDVGKDVHAVDKSPKKEDLIFNNCQGKSYDISPYQCSDDEDEEDDELPTKKSIPSWASKSSVALLLPLQKLKDPDRIFPAESFCSMEEVLLPRKLQQKQK